MASPNCFFWFDVLLDNTFTEGPVAEILTTGFDGNFFSISASVDGGTTGEVTPTMITPATAQVSAVPEPASALLFAGAAAGLGALGWRRRSKASS